MEYKEVITKKEGLEKLILELTKKDIHTNGRLNDIERIHLVEYQKQYLYLKQIEKLQQENQQLKKQQKDLISYLKNQIDICDGCIDVMTSDLKEIMPGRAGKTYLTSEIFKNEITKECYQDILNKIEKRDK